jgi:hypothetical protein
MMKMRAMDGRQTHLVMTDLYSLKWNLPPKPRVQMQDTLWMKVIQDNTQFNYVYVKDGDTFEYEVIIPWNSITSNQTTLDDFRERGTFYFDIGYKLNVQMIPTYFAWSNNDNNIWRETHRAGVVTLEGVSA